MNAPNKKETENRKSLVKQDIVDIVLEDLENKGPIMKKLKEKLNPYPWSWDWSGYVSTGDVVLTPEDMDKASRLKQKGLL